MGASLCFDIVKARVPETVLSPAGNVVRPPRGGGEFAVRDAGELAGAIQVVLDATLLSRFASRGCRTLVSHALKSVRAKG
jgi:hypothetical protein